MDRALHARFENDPVLRAAAAWFVELRSPEVSVERISEWQRWLALDVAHGQAFESIEAFWMMSDRVRWPTDAEVDVDAYDGKVSISDWERAQASRAAPAGRGKRLAIAAGLLGTVVGLGWLAAAQWADFSAPWGRPTQTRVILTSVGETRSLKLEDGSTVALGGDSAVALDFDRQQRKITLTRGEAFFDVAQEPSRPFVVQANGTAVTAVGTAFNVRKAGQRLVVVAVSEGAVNVGATPADPARAVTMPTARRLQAGQQLILESDGSAAQVLAVDASAVAGWRQGRLQYFNETLETVVADLARYSTPRIRIGDAEVAHLRVTGIVFEGNIEGWLRGLESTFGVEMVRGEDGAVTLRRARTTSETP
jgi:transmembrane sensor